MAIKDKAPEVLLMMEAILPGSVERVLSDTPKCPFCGRGVNKEKDFVDDLSRREFEISGLCQKCQDDTFG